MSYDCMSDTSDDCMETVPLGLNFDCSTHDCIEPDGLEECMYDGCMEPLGTPPWLGTLLSPSPRRTRSTKRVTRSASKGVVNAARVSKGTFHDVWGGLGLKDPQRHPRERITVTCVIYHTITGGLPTEADVMAAVDDMEALYTSCGQVVHSPFLQP